MPLQIVNQDITKIRCDAIVNPTNHRFRAGGGTDYAVHSAAGPAMDTECSALGYLETGAVAVTGGYALPCSHVIHTVGPRWHGGERHETVLLRSCYTSALFEAHRLGAESIAFPLISAGTYGFPKDRVLRIAIDAITDYLFTADRELDVYICIRDRKSFELGREIALWHYLDGRKSFICDNDVIRLNEPEPEAEAAEADEAAPIYPEVFEHGRVAQLFQAPAHDFLLDESLEAESAQYVPIPQEPILCEAMPAMFAIEPEAGAEKAKKKEGSLADWIRRRDDTFAVLLLKLIDRKGMDDVQCYKKANVSKNTFWKINNDATYRPSKETVLAFAIALELDIDEAKELLRAAGYALSGNYVFDVIIEYYITNGMYDIFEINASLFKYDQKLLGCKE